MLELSERQRVIFGKKWESPNQIKVCQDLNSTQICLSHYLQTRQEKCCDLIGISQAMDSNWTGFFVQHLLLSPKPF